MQWCVVGLGKQYKRRWQEKYNFIKQANILTAIVLELKHGVFFCEDNF